MHKEIRSLREYIDALNRENLLEYVSGSDVGSVCARMVMNLTYDSRKVCPDTLFVCKGLHFKSIYLNEAIHDGAFAYICEEIPEDANEDAFAIVVNDIRAAMAILAKLFFGDLSSQIKLIAVTGTKGKSTTTFFLRYIMDAYLTTVCDKKVAFSSSIETYDGYTCKASLITTPEIFDLYELMSNAVENEIPYMIIEVSSQALKYMRVEGLRFEEAAFLNIGEDHISPIEHSDFRDYFSSKLKIFDNAKHAIINKDAEFYAIIEDAAERTAKALNFSSLDKNANVYAYNLDSVDGRPNFDVRIKGLGGYSVAKGHIEMGAYGTINVENALAAIAVAVDLGVPFEFIRRGLSEAVVPGRMELYTIDEDKTVIVDYAHNKLSFESLFKNIKKDFPRHKIVTLFGAVGGKAYDRRREVGTVVGKNADFAIITERLSGEENVYDICEEIAYYVEQQGCEYEIIPDRVEAVRRAMAMAAEGTIIILAGKGHERVEKRGSNIIETPSDVDLVEYYLLQGNRSE